MNELGLLAHMGVHLQRVAHHLVFCGEPVALQEFVSRQWVHRPLGLDLMVASLYYVSANTLGIG